MPKHCDELTHRAWAHQQICLPWNEPCLLNIWGSWTLTGWNKATRTARTTHGLETWHYLATATMRRTQESEPRREVLRSSWCVQQFRLSETSTLEGLGSRQVSAPFCKPPNTRLYVSTAVNYIKQSTFGGTSSSLSFLFKSRRLLSTLFEGNSRHDGGIVAAIPMRSGPARF